MEIYLLIVPSILYAVQMYLRVFSSRGQNRELPLLTSAHGEHLWFGLDATAMVLFTWSVSDSSHFSGSILEMSEVFLRWFCLLLKRMKYNFWSRHRLWMHK
jgi:hypothetical protein